MCRQAPTLNMAFPLAYDGEGLFSEMISPPWGTTITGTELDIMFFSEYGTKPVSPLVHHYLPPYDEALETQTGLTDVNRAKIASLLLKRFSVNWEKKFAITTLEYVVNDNTRLTESETIGVLDTGTNTQTQNRTLTVDGTDTIERALTIDKTDTINRELTISDESTTDTTTNIDSTDTNNTTINATSTDNVFGFNSATAVPSDSGTGTNTTVGTVVTDRTDVTAVAGTDNRTDTEITTDVLTQSDAENQTVNTDRTDTEILSNVLAISSEANTTRATTREGSIGVVTTQSMLQQEINLWGWNYFSDVFKDASKLLALPIY